MPTPGAGSLTLTGSAPLVNTIQVPTGNLVLSSSAPDVVVGTVFASKEVAYAVDGPTTARLYVNKEVAYEADGPLTSKLYVNKEVLYVAVGPIVEVPPAPIVRPVMVMT